ncbi:MAG: hypothetical protein JJU40_03915 [Rhodobacteraceae bacterium]|nr:hypothetical protein [Paracoccaceae bacterium]
MQAAAPGRGPARALALAVALSLVLGGCAGLRDSRLNPFNWFGGERESRVAASTAEVGDPRMLVPQVLSLGVDRIASGAVINAMGLPPTQGHWDAELVALNAGRPVNGTLSFEFRLSPPPGPTRAGTQRSREVLAGTFVSTQRLEGVRQIEVIAGQNRRSVRR